MDFVGVVIGGVLVIVANAVSELLRARGERGLDTEKRADDRRLGHEQFQRETLVKLQDAAYDLMVATTRVKSAHKAKADADGEWGGAVPGDIDDEGVRSLVAVLAMRSRLADDELRKITKRFTDICGEVIGATDEETADEAFARVGPAELALQARAGRLIRDTFRVAEAQTPQPGAGLGPVRWVSAAVRDVARRVGVRIR